MATFHTTTYKVYTDLSRNDMLELIGMYSSRQNEIFSRVLALTIHQHIINSELYSICMETCYKEDANVLTRITSALEKGHFVDAFGNITDWRPKNDNENPIKDDCIPY